MSEEQVETTAAEPTVDADRDEEVQAMTLEQRQEALKQSRWNVFLWLGIAVLMFGFALFPMSFDENYDPYNFTKSVDKDIGWVWGPSLSGEDFMDVPLTIDAKVQMPPAQEDVHLTAYALQKKDCSILATEMKLARSGADHAYQYQLLDETPVAGGEYTFDFKLDSGHYCVVVQFVDSDGMTVSDEGTAMAVEGSVYPNQVIGGIFGIVCLSLSAFAFIGAQRHGESVRSLLEGDLETTETKVLASISSERIAAGPAAGPPGADGPAGPPDASGPSGPPQKAEPATPESPPADAPIGDQAAEQSYTYEPAENGYFFRKMPDGSYDQTVYVQNEDGTYSPHEA